MDNNCLGVLSLTWAGGSSGICALCDITKRLFPEVCDFFFADNFRKVGHVKEATWCHFLISEEFTDRARNTKGILKRFDFSFLESK